MAKIEGVAKKFDGSPVDYVSIFNWSNGKCIAQVAPNIAGKWVYNYYTNLNIGITYIANGCEPVTHGAYTFDFDVVNYLEFKTKNTKSSTKELRIDIVIDVVVGQWSLYEKDTLVASSNGGSLVSGVSITGNANKLTIALNSDGVEKQYKLYATASVLELGHQRANGSGTDGTIEVLSFARTVLNQRIVMRNTLITVPEYLPPEITNTVAMFYESDLFNQDISMWDMSNIVSADGMFTSATSFNQDISAWNTVNINNMASMFFGASSFNQDLSSWCVPNIYSSPLYFSNGATAWSKPKPLWGSCPRGENL